MYVKRFCKTFLIYFLGGDNLRGAYDKITIWNEYRNAENKSAWKRSVIDNCSWETDITKTASGTTANIASSVVVLVAENANYRPFNQWVTDKQGFTFSVGDLVARGEILTEITGTTPFTSAMVKTSLLPEVFVIKAFSYETEGYKKGRHYEISGV